MPIREEDRAAAAVALTAPKVTPEDLGAAITHKQFIRVGPRELVTVCVITVRNGFSFVGTAGCVSEANFNEKLGREIAERNAMNLLWAAEGYALAERIREGRA